MKSLEFSSNNTLGSPICKGYTPREGDISMLSAILSNKNNSCQKRNLAFLKLVKRNK